METGTSIPYAIDKLQDRGTFFVPSGEPVYQGQVTGEHIRQNDIVVTYFLLKKNGKIENVKNDFDKIIINEIVPHLEKFVGMNLEEYNSHKNYYKFVPQSILDIHTGESYEGEFEPTYPKFYITVFVSIALVILVLACINFMNLTTARSSTRSIEIGLRKISGATRKQLISQFLIESIILSIISLIFATAIIEIISGLDSGTSTFSHNTSNLPYILIFTIVSLRNLISWVFLLKNLALLLYSISFCLSKDLA